MHHSSVLIHQIFIFVQTVISGTFNKDAGFFLIQNSQEKKMTVFNKYELQLKVQDNSYILQYSYIPFGCMKVFFILGRKLKLRKYSLWQMRTALNLEKNQNLFHNLKTSNARTISSFTEIWWYGLVTICNFEATCRSWEAVDTHSQNMIFTLKISKDENEKNVNCFVPEALGDLHPTPTLVVNEALMKSLMLFQVLLECTQGCCVRAECRKTKRAVDTLLSLMYSLGYYL